MRSWVKRKTGGISKYRGYVENKVKKWQGPALGAAPNMSS